MKATIKQPEAFDKSFGTRKALIAFLVNTPCRKEFSPAELEHLWKTLPKSQRKMWQWGVQRPSGASEIQKFKKAKDSLMWNHSTGSGGFSMPGSSEVYVKASKMARVDAMHQARDRATTQYIMGMKNVLPDEQDRYDFLLVEKAHDFSYEWDNDMLAKWRKRVVAAKDPQQMEKAINWAPNRKFRMIATAWKMARKNGNWSYFNKYARGQVHRDICHWWEKLLVGQPIKKREVDMHPLMQADIGPVGLLKRSNAEVSLLIRRGKWFAPETMVEPVKWFGSMGYETLSEKIDIPMLVPEIQDNASKNGTPTNEVCPICGSNMSLELRQLRSADEGETLIFTCLSGSCGKRYRDFVPPPIQEEQVEVAVREIPEEPQVLLPMETELPEVALWDIWFGSFFRGYQWVNGSQQLIC